MTFDEWFDKSVCKALYDEEEIEAVKRGYKDCWEAAQNEVRNSNQTANNTNDRSFTHWCG